MKIGLVSVFVESPEKAFAYYTETLGFVKRVFIPEAYIAIVASPEDKEGTGLMLEPNQNPIALEYQTGLYKAGIPCILFSTDDIYKEYERLKKLGVQFKKGPASTDEGIEAVFDDTFGNYIMLFQFKS